jgi:D-threonate/D-erythronate kinase
MSSGLQVAIIADDLTGALDTAAPFASAGLSALVRLGAGDSIAPPCPDVLALSTESRHVAAEIAAPRAEEAARSLRAAAPAIWLKKIDSTLRGNVAAEIFATLRASGRRHVLVAPAAPAQGRTVRAGEVFVNGVALRDTEFARDGASPAAGLPLQRILESPGNDLDLHVWTSGAPLGLAPGEGRRAYVADAASDADLDRVAAFALAHRDDLLIVGSSGIGAALARRLVRPGAARTAIASAQPARWGRILFVIGSRTGVSSKQIARLRAVGVEEIVVPAAAPKAERCKALPIEPRHASTPHLLLRPDTATVAHPEDVARRLAEATVDFILRSSVDSLVIVGGDTASAVFAALSVRDYPVLGEVMPGIPLGRVAVDPTRSLLVVTKSGGFGGPDTLVAIARHLRAS